MPESDPQFVELEKLLRHAGIVNEHSQRLVEEIQDHYFDRRADAIEDGYDERRAGEIALSAIGAPADIAAAAAQCRDLLTISQRYPLIAGFTNGFISVVSAPALPVHYCAQRREPIARWSASVGIAAMLTAGLLLTLQTLLGFI